MIRRPLRILSLLLGLGMWSVGCERSPATTSPETQAKLAQLEERIAKLEAQAASSPRADAATPRAAETAGTAAAEVTPKASSSTETPAVTESASPDAGPVASGGNLQPVPNAALKGTMGRIVVTFPAGAKVDNTHVAVNKSGDAKNRSGAGYGNFAIELLPGKYDVNISGAPIGGVEVKSKHDTSIPVGVLRISADANTHVAVTAEGGKKQLTAVYGSNDIGLPAGKYNVTVAGQSAPIEIKAGQVTNF